MVLFYKEISIRITINIVYSKPIIIKKIIDSYEKSKGVRYKKIIIIIIIIKTI